MSWVAVAVAAVGAGTTLYGANAQKKANTGAQNANIAAQEEQNSGAWGAYLMSRGMAPTVPLQPGVLPAAGQYKATNVKLPLWMTLQTPPKPAAKKGGFLIPRA